MPVRPEKGCKRKVLWWILTQRNHVAPCPCPALRLDPSALWGWCEVPARTARTEQRAHLPVLCSEAWEVPVAV